MTGQERRTKMFDEYAANLSAWFPDCKDVFVCPLCKMIFPREALDLDLLSLEHCLPGSVGGTGLTLTCKACNNRDGTKLDSQLKSRLEVDGFLQGKGIRQRGHITVGGNKVRADIEIVPGEVPAISVFLRDKHSHPEHLRGLTESLSRSFDDTERLAINLNTKFQVSITRSRVALLRAAFLMAFKAFGYGYILHPHLECVRQQIMAPEPVTIAEDAVLRIRSAVPDASSIMILIAPSELRCFVVPICTMAGSVEVTFGVLLPGLDEDAARLYRRSRALRDSKTVPDTFTFRPLPYELEQVPPPEMKEFPFYVWKEHCQ